MSKKPPIAEVEGVSATIKPSEDGYGRCTLKVAAEGKAAGHALERLIGEAVRITPIDNPGPRGSQDGKCRKVALGSTDDKPVRVTASFEGGRMLAEFVGRRLAVEKTQAELLPEEDAG